MTAAALAAVTLGSKKCWIITPTGCGKPIYYKYKSKKWFNAGNYYGRSQAKCKSRYGQFTNYCNKRSDIKYCWKDKSS